ncbi:cytochrome c nitrite reductase small subunit [Helicobacter sp. faydin-H20]|uniref:cytochrome c nitrite reductase small subunit n=1 Tax=Helicobacter anatolicus TaxID=2905874 RepID=UPI001E374552|nr:cytochrome c nitrite reductase small subunit [Helicobacter anatolicus]MCE3037591.1 cytochrome c nitrite reductase small subunit [Helicobacter anatolicus]
MRKKAILFSLLVLIVGALVGGGFFIFYNANGLSYLSSDSAACNNCHVMHEVYDDYNKSSHKAVARCIDCHLPHTFFRKWVAKAESGLGHMMVFTFEKNLPTHFEANEKTKKWVQENCISCHKDYVENITNPTLKAQHQDQSLSCVSCHKNVGHKRNY